MIHQVKPDWMLYYTQSANTEVVSRMYLALVLFSLLKDLNSGSCRILEEFWPFRALLTELTRRLSYCVTSELIP
ncbi:hypothetical protein F7725_014924 [Dissostichus mawsoni]|uniref:Uncharacterized protein n=1 Tax=Dissostichus mawsoni TaxID=36200 RepID=A0A7J5YIY3_DISMA|nr:hypothetical protein F7725_014924 [Dissostichus mawsoni]